MCHIQPLRNGRLKGKYQQLPYTYLNPCRCQVIATRSSDTKLNLKRRGKMASKANSGNPATEKRLTALVVDGGRTCQAVEKGLLRHYGIETQVVDNGKDAVDLFASGTKFDILMIDISLPGLSGLEATRQIRAMGVDCKIVGLAAYGLEEERRAFLEAGADEFFEKPVPHQQLVRILRDINNSN